MYAGTVYNNTFFCVAPALARAHAGAAIALLVHICTMYKYGVITP